MRQKFKSLFLMLLCIGMCSAHVGAEKPSVVSATPTVGESYYLYNVGTGKFLSSYNYKKLNPSLSPYGLKLTIGSATDGGYTITVASTQGMLYASSTQYIEIDTLGGNETRYSWNFIKQEDGTYKIQCAQNNAFYVSNNYVGWNNETIEQIRFEQTGCIDWAFLTQEDYEAIAYQLPTTNYDFPELPASKLVSGSTYYLYNVGARGFLNSGDGSASNIYLQENPKPIQIEKLDNGAYTMQLTSITRGYIYNEGINCKTGNYSTTSTPNCYWTIEDAGDDTYMIQRSPLNTSYYNAVEYMGWSGNHTTIVANQPQDYGAKWKLIPADATGDRLVAQLKLYNALAKSDAYAGKGWNISYYTDLYATRATAPIEEMTKAAQGLCNGLGMSAGYIAPYWNERLILFQTSEGSFGRDKYVTWALDGNQNTIGKSFCRHNDKNNAQITSILQATTNVEEPSTFIYELSGSALWVKIYVDDTLARELENEQWNLGADKTSSPRFFEVLPPGSHTIKFVFFSSDGYLDATIRNIGVMASPLISVNLLEPGSLGTEVLYNTNHIKNVRRLKIKGKMNADDWSKIKMMHYLQELDLSEAEITEIPKEQFSCSSDTSSLFLHKMALPEGVKRINASAFYQSFLDSLDFPNSLPSVIKHSNVAIFES